MLRDVLHLSQPTNYSCAQTVAAMYLGLSLEETLVAMPDRKSGTRTRTLVDFLRKHSVQCGSRLTSLRGKRLPEVCVVRIVWPNKKGHFVLKNGSVWHDPLLSTPFTGTPPTSGEWAGGGRITSFLELK